MNNTGFEKAREVADKLKGETLAKLEGKEEQKAIVVNQLQALQQNSELAKMYQENVAVGAANLAAELPLLKVHAVGKSTANTLVDGSEPSDGYFFYKPTQEQFKTVNCHILTISKGFRAEGLEGKETFNQIVGGVIKDGKEYKPFVMYFTGLKLQHLWDFGKMANKFTHAKPVGIPMFALTVELTAEKQETPKYGKVWVVKFAIVSTEDGTPQLVLDPGEFQFLKDNVETVEDTIASLIVTKTVKEDESAVPSVAIDGEVTQEPEYTTTPF